MSHLFNTIGFIGAGEMSRCIIDGLFASGCTSKIVTHCRSEKTRSHQNPKTELLESNQDVIDASDLVFIGVRPQDYKCLESLKFGNHLVCSMICGLTIDFLTKITDIKPNNLVRIMPNIAIKGREGVTGIFCEDQTNQKSVTDLLSPCSIMIPCDSEDKINDIIGVSGSTQAFILYLLEGLEKFAIEKFDTDPREVIQRVLSGVSGLLKEDRSMSQIRESICSEGGATIEGVRLMQQRGVLDAMYSACERSSDRGREMEKQICIHE